MICDKKTLDKFSLPCYPGPVGCLDLVDSLKITAAELLIHPDNLPLDGIDCLCKDMVADPDGRVFGTSTTLVSCQGSFDALNQGATTEGSPRRLLVKPGLTEY